MPFRLTVNLGNSIIGVSILTMPYCFRQCGVLLSIVSILLSGLLNRAGCHLLFRCAVLTRKRSFEEMARQALGPIGKMLVEVCVLGFLVGTCVAYFVVIGDLGPSIISDVTGLDNSPHLRAFTMTFVGMFVALPLGLLRRVDSLASLSALSFGVYLLLAVKLFSETSVNLLSEEPGQQIGSRFVWWNVSGLPQNIPIFAMSLSCQSQLFELFDHSLLNFDDYDVVPKLNRIVRQAVHMCSIVYVSIGFFGYVAFHDAPFGGNILSFFPASIGSTIMKMAFVATIAVSLPLCFFPCRTSLYSLLMKQNSDSSRSSLMNEFGSGPSLSHYMSDKHFRFLTVLLIVFTVSISIIVPRIEFVLSIVGSTTGTIICFVLPGLIYSQLTKKDTTERLTARFLTFFGLSVLVVCTFVSLSSFTQNVVMEDAVAIHSNGMHSNPTIRVPAASAGAPAVMQEPVADLSKAEAVVEDASVLKRKQEELLRELEKNQKEQKKLIDEQKKVLQELKKHEETHSEDANQPVVSQNSSGSSSVEHSKSRNQLAKASSAVNTGDRPSRNGLKDVEFNGRPSSVKLREKNLTDWISSAGNSSFKSGNSIFELPNKSKNVTTSPKTAS